jgi:hypothetical protein
MLATMQFRIFFILACYLKTLRLKLTKLLFSCFLYGCKTKSLFLREKHIEKVENGVLRRIFGPRRDEVGGSWRKLHNEELHSLYSLPDINYWVDKTKFI